MPAELASVTDTRTRTRKVPAWKPDNPKHAWEDIDVDGHHHRCVHCWLRYHHEPSGAGWVKVWDHGSRRGKASKSLGPCPGPSGRPQLEVVPTPVELSTPETAHPCCRCVPPLEPCGLPTRKTPDGFLCEPQREAARGSRATGLAELRSATSGMGVPTWRGEAS